MQYEGFEAMQYAAFVGRDAIQYAESIVGLAAAMQYAASFAFLDAMQ
jgi:hypothetical protein